MCRKCQQSPSDELAEFFLGGIDWLSNIVIAVIVFFAAIMGVIVLLCIGAAVLNALGLI